MKVKKITCLLVVMSVLVSSVLSTSITAFAQEDLTFSDEYKSSPFYEKLHTALADSQDKTTMERTLAAALSQEGYKNYSTEGIDIEQARADGLLWTGAQLRMNEDDTGNTEYIRWAQRYIMNRSEETQYIDCDWCAIFVSWCMYQAGYYSEDRLKKYYYSYYADPRIEFDADSWIEAFDFDQQSVWYTEKARHKIDAYNWNTYYNVDVDPFEIPYKPGGILFFTWDGSGKYFNHAVIVVDYDKETHVLTYTNGCSDGMVITKQIDLDVEEEFIGKPFTQNSNRIMAYAEYDKIRPLEPKEITADASVINWSVDSASGIRIKTNSDSKIGSVSVDGEYLGSNIESNMLLREGTLSIGKSELLKLSEGQHTLTLTFDDGSIDVVLNIIPEYQIGDVDLDGNVSINDATLIQFYLAELETLSEQQLLLADTNGDGEVTINDATHLQEYLADLGVVLGKTTV